MINLGRTQRWHGRTGAVERARVALLARRLRKGLTMKAKVELVYEDTTKNRQLEVPIKGAPKGASLMNAIERGVEKLAKDDKDWQRWNLVTIED
jgi:hypothetical protein